MTRSVFGKLLLMLLVGSLLSSVTCPVRADSHPRNGTEAWNAGFRGIVEPDTPTVLQKLHSLCPTIDEEHFTANLLAVYEYSMLISYAHDSYVYGVDDYWQTSEETILLGHGDCEDQAINLATLIETLYKQTYGYIPFNLVWVVWGYVETPSGEGCHAWVLVNNGLLPKETIEEIKMVSVLEAVVNIFLGGIAYASDLINEIEASLNLADLGSKNNQQLSLFYSGERYFELEPTWNLPISEFYFKKYPYTQVYAIFNSQGYDTYPDFYPVEQPPFMGAEIKNIAFPNRVIVDNTCTTNVTVQNYDCGILGADLVVILKDYGLEVARQSAYVYKYWWQVQTFVFTLLAIEPARTEQMSAELYWNNWGNMILIDFKNFTIETISNIPDLVPFSLFTYPENACEGQLVVFNILGQNLGPKSATSFAIDILVDNQPFDSIWMTGCSGFSGFWTKSKPWTAVAGTHFLRVIVDATSVVSEHNETNNEIVVPLVVRSNKGSYVYVQVGSSSDDCQKWNNTSGGGWQWSLTNGMNVAGCPYVLWGEDNFGCGLRFTNITIPRGARINYAYLELCAAWDDESQVRSKLHGQNTDDALSFSTLQDFDSRPWTSACVYWDDIPAWKTGTRYTSPDISMILQEIVDRSNWQSGNSVVVIWEDFESRSISYIENSRRAWSFDGNPSLAPKLLIDYEDVIPPTIVILSPQNTSYYGSIPLTFTVDEPVSWIGCSLDNQANVTTVGDTILTGLAGGSHTIVVYANDTSGNMGASDKVFFTVQLPPKYALTVQSSPSGIAFTANSVSHVTPWSGTFDEGSSIVLMMPETHVNGEAKYVWDRWNDGETSRSRTVTTNTDISLTANFAGPYYQLTVTSSPITGIPFTINAVPKTTPYVDWLLEGSYSLEMPQTYNGYNWSRWLEDGDASRIKTIHHHGNTWTGVYEWTKIAVPIKGGENATVEGNVTITNVLVTKNTLHFDASGPPGSTGWINVTFPMVNTTNLKVFINNEKLTPPPFPIITTNGTHYFIYFEFTLSTKSIAILFSLEPPIADFTWSPSIPKSNQPVTFDGSSSSADNASIVSYEWDFGDGTHSFGQIVTHSYTASGFYTVTLNVTDSEGFWDIEQKQVQVEALPIPPPLSASINPLSASILLGQSVTFTSTVSGGYTPYSYQWYLNGAPVSGATSNTWTFTPTTSGIYYIYLKVTDAEANTAQSDTARITFPPPPPVGGYSIPTRPQTRAEPVLPYIALVAALTAIFTKLRPKTKRKH